MIRNCELEDTGMYSFEIKKFVKEGEPDQIDCLVDIERNKTMEFLFLNPPPFFLMIIYF